MNKLNTQYGNFISKQDQLIKVSFNEGQLVEEKNTGSNLRVGDIIHIKPNKVGKKDAAWIKERYLFSRVEKVTNVDYLILGNDDWDEAMRIKGILNAYGIVSFSHELNSFGNNIVVISIPLSDSINVGTLLTEKILIKDLELREEIKQIYFSFPDEVLAGNRFIRNLPLCVIQKIEILKLNEGEYNELIHDGFLDVITGEII